MDAQTIVAIVIAVVVPIVAFRLALRQDQARWLRERRAETYVDLLTEAHAEMEYFRYTTADDDVRERMSKYFKDLRLPELERARLGARGTIFASREVNILANRLDGLLARESMVRPRHEGDRAVTRVRVAGAFEELQDAIRRELGADKISLGGKGSVLGAAFRKGWQRAGGGAKPAG
jgi:hypothetical protein